MLKPSARKPLPNLTEVFCFSTVDEHRLLAGRNTSELDEQFLFDAALSVEANQTGRPLYGNGARRPVWSRTSDQLKDGCDQLIKHTQKDATSIRNCEQRTNGECSSKASRVLTSTRSFCGLMEMWPETRRRTVFTVQSKGTQRHTKVIKATDAPGLQIVTRSDLCVFFLFGFHSMGPCDTEPKNPHADSFQLADLGCVRCVSVHYTLHPVRNHHGSRVSSPHHL